MDNASKTVSNDDGDMNKDILILPNSGRLTKLRRHRTVKVEKDLSGFRVHVYNITT
jgi:hypothetical protein